MRFLNIDLWRWVAFYFECGAAALLIGWWHTERKVIKIKRRPPQ